MHYEDPMQTIKNYSSRNLEQRKDWYSPVARAYDKARPRYPQKLIQQVIKIAQLSSDSKILEVGCGPATATLSFAELGSPMICLEPNQEFYQLAQHNCNQYPNVEIQNTSFEEWMIQPNEFNVVLAATSFHWIPPHIGYPKAAKALQENGYLILLWNKQLQPSYEVYQNLSEVYQFHAPDLEHFEDREIQEKILQGLGQVVLDSGLFKGLICGHVESEVNYTVDEYLTLLSTYSPYLELASDVRKALFEGLRSRIELNYRRSLQLSYVSAFQVAQKCEID